jgi:hypothetical protein
MDGRRRVRRSGLGALAGLVVVGCGSPQDRVVDVHDRVGQGPPISGPMAVGRQLGPAEAHLEAGVTRSLTRQLEGGSGRSSPAALVSHTSLRARVAVGLSRRVELGLHGEYAPRAWAEATRPDLDTARAPGGGAGRVGLQLRVLAVVPEPLGVGLMLQSTHAYWSHHERVLRSTNGGPFEIVSEDTIRHANWQPAIGAFVPLRPLPELELSLGVLVEAYPLLVTVRSERACFDAADPEDCAPWGGDVSVVALETLFASASYEAGQLAFTAYAFRNIPDDRASEAVPAGAGILVGYRFDIPRGWYESGRRSRR